MSPKRLLLSVGLVILLLLVVVVGLVRWYLFGPSAVAAADLVPANTLVFATIPNGVAIAAGYQSSNLKTLIDDPTSASLVDFVAKTIGKDNLDLLQTFAPNLSGQSFLALTRYDPDHPEQAGLVAAMKPKPGLGNFDAFVTQLKSKFPDALKNSTNGTGEVAGYSYQWLKGPGAQDKIYVAQIGGWIVTTWGEATLQDWIERYERKSTTPSLSQSPDYQKSLARIGTPMTVGYLNCHEILELISRNLANHPSALNHFSLNELAGIGGLAIGTGFESGEIVDRFSFLIPHDVMANSSFGTTTCAYDTLKFSSLNTRFYWATNFDWKKAYKNYQEQLPGLNGIANLTGNPLQMLAKGLGLDLQHDVIDALGSEVSIQMEWNDDADWPEAGLFIKLDHPDTFKPVIQAIIAAAHAATTTTAEVRRITSDGQNFESLQFVQALPVAPTITEDGPYLGLFTSQNLAVRSFQRGEITLLHNDMFNRLIGKQRLDATQVFFLDSPSLINRAYTVAKPYVSLASLFSKPLAAFLSTQTLPDDASWLAPIGDWASVVKADDDGLKDYSVSGIGNQGILLWGGLSGGYGALRATGMLPANLDWGVHPSQVPPSVTPTPPGPAIKPPTNAAPSSPPAPDPNAAH